MATDQTGKTVTRFPNADEDFSDTVVGAAFAVRVGRLITGQQQYSAPKVAEMLIEALGV